MTNKNKWLLAISSVVALAATILLLRKNLNSGEERPPKNAPQLDLENPGSQDDFPVPPMESEIG